MAKKKIEGKLRPGSAKNYKGGVHLRNLQPHIVNQFKSRCALHGKTMRYVMVQFMKAYIRSGKLPE